MRDDEIKNITPVILGGQNDVRCLIENFHFNDMTTENIISGAENFKIDEFMKNQMTEDPDFYESVKGKWPKEPMPQDSLRANTDILSGEPLKEVYIGLVPTSKSFEVPAYLRYGNWNDCPAPEDHVGIHKYWFEKYGAEIISITGDVIECTVKNPPGTREDALKLANEQFLYCTDIVTQGVESIENLAATLLNSKYWYFWWD